jgi:hypothetical protein
VAASISGAPEGDHVAIVAAVSTPVKSASRKLAGKSIDLTDLKRSIHCYTGKRRLFITYSSDSLKALLTGVETAATIAT